MGIIDSTHYSLTCTSCGAIDTPSAHQKGSAYSGGSWSGPDSKVFLLHTEDSYGEDVIKSASCPCGGEVEVKITRTGP